MNTRRGDLNDNELSLSGNGTVLLLKIQPKSMVHLYQIQQSLLRHLSEEVNFYKFMRMTMVSAFRAILSRTSLRESRELYQISGEFLDVSFNSVLKFIFSPSLALCTNKPIKDSSSNILSEKPTNDGIYIKFNPSKSKLPKEIDLSDLDLYTNECFVDAESIPDKILKGILTKYFSNSDTFSCVDDGYYYHTKEYDIAPAFTTRLGACFNHKINQLLSDSTITMNTTETLFFKAGNFRHIVMNCMKFYRAQRVNEGRLWSFVENIFVGIKLSPVNRSNEVFSFNGFTWGDFSEMT